MSHFAAGGQSHPPYSAMDRKNEHHNPTSDTEMIHMEHEAHVVRTKVRPFDWLICSVLGYIFCPLTGICAIYYAVRANHNVDWERDPELIRNHTKRAKCLTLTSIILGLVVLVAVVIMIAVTISNFISTARMNSSFRY